MTWDDDDVYFSGDTAEHGAARRSDPQTSHDAAESVKTSYLQGLICETLARARTGLITHEIADVTRIGIQTISPRMRPMSNKGLVYDTGEKRVWMGSPSSPATNRQSIVWQLTRLRSEDGSDPGSVNGNNGSR